MSGFHSASEHIKTSLILIFCIGAVIAISYGAPYWTTRPDGHAGLWTGCTQKICYDRWELWTSAWIHATQAFMTLAIICIFFAGVALCVFVFHRAYEDDKRLVCLSMILTGFTSLFVLVAVFIWAANEHFGSGEVLNWPYALACCCCLTAFITTVFLYLDLKRPVK